MKRPSPRQQKLASVYDADVWPLGPLRAAEPLLRALPRRPKTVALEYGCATGQLARAVAERQDDESRVVAVAPSPAKIEIATAELARALKPGGKLLVTLPLRGAWAEFLDLYRDGLREHGKHDALASLQVYEKTLPDPVTATRWLESANLTNVTLETVRWELLFKSAREFFFAPIIELGPLSTWMQIAGGRGGEMQDVFFFVKEAIETYFSGLVFPVTMVVGLLQGERRS